MPKAFIFYQYFYPDDVISSIHFSELCNGLVDRGWEVSAFPCNRGCRDESRRYSPRDEWRNILIKRLWRPKLEQASTLGRLFNALWLIVRWSLLALHPKLKPDVLVVGTDPVLSIVVAPFWRFFKPQTKIVHWCFDLYPEAAFAEGILRKESRLAKLICKFLKHSYAACNLIVDIGPCMRQLLADYGSPAKTLTLVPWAMEEPDSALRISVQERESIFSGANLALMYSGNFGRAHSYLDLLELVRLLRSEDVQLAFSVRGNREEELYRAVGTDDFNVRFVPFAPQEKLRERLACADIHIVSLRDEWTGTVVPSKFFGALAVGRPVLFCGRSDSAIAKWIAEHEIGWVLSRGRGNEVAKELRAFAASPSARELMFQHCHRVYHEQFSRDIIIDRWATSLSNLIR